MGARPRSPHHKRGQRHPDAPEPRASAETILPSPAQAASLLRSLGLRPKRRYSQSFLIDPRVADAAVRAARLDESDVVLEIGPGLGVLTRGLVRRAGRVMAVELDPELADRLPTLVPAPNLTVVQGDALSFEPGESIGSAYKLVANLPYHLTSPLVLRYLQLDAPPALSVVMVQWEVAERIAAGPGDLSYLAIAVQAVARAEIVRRVPASAFHPRPKVDSALLRLTPRERPLVPRSELASLLGFVRAAFAQPRKRLANSLAQGTGLRKSDVGAFLAAEGVAESTRPHEIPLEDWATLAQAWAARESR